MDNKEEQKLRGKDILFCICLIGGIIGLLFLFCGSEFSKILATQKLPITFYIMGLIYIVCLIIVFYPSIRYYIKHGLDRYFVPSQALDKQYSVDVIQKLNVDDSYDIHNPQILKLLKKINNNENKSQSQDNELLELLEKGKIDIFIEKCTQKINQPSDNRDVLKYVVLRYMGIVRSDKNIYNTYMEHDIREILHFQEELQKKGIYKDTSKLHQLFIECRSNLVVLYYKLNRYDDMHRENKKLIKLITNDCQVDNSLKAKSLQLRAMYHIEKKQIAYAIGYFNEALSYVRNEYYILYNMYMLYFHEYNNLSKSIEILSKMLALDDISAEHYQDTVNSLAYVLSLQGRYEEAYEYLDNFCTQNNPDERTLANKCYLANKLKKDREALDLANQVMEKIPSDMSCLKIKSFYQINNGEYDYAIQNLSEAIRQFEDVEKGQKNHFFTGEAYYYRALAYLKKGERQMAHQDFDKAVECGFYDFDSQYIVDFDLDNDDLKKEDIKENKDAA